MESRSPAELAVTWLRQRRRSTSLALQVVGLALLPLVLLAQYIALTASRGILAFDARTGYLPYARGLVHGVSPYPGADLPPFGFIPFIPFTAVPRPEILLTVLAVATVPAVLLALDVRDWRCYGAAFLWAPVLSAIQTVNLTLLLVLAAALAWRWRDRPALSGAATGLAIAAKLISAPLLAWLTATRRLRAAVLSVVVAVVVTLGLLALIELTLGGATKSFFDRAQEVPVGATTPSYSPADILFGQGLPRWSGAAVVLVVAAVLCGLSVRFGRMGDDRRSFGAAATAIIVFAPNVWLHSLTFLLLPLGVLRPRFDGLWLVPAVLIVVGVGDPATWEWLLLWAVFAIVAAWSLVRPTCNLESSVAGR